jgi:hypothetical protein
MKFILSCILSLFVSITFGQGPLIQLLFEGNLADSSGNNVQFSTTGTYVYSATKYQGDSSWYPSGANLETNDSIELGRHFSISGWYRMSTATGSGLVVSTESASGGVGFNIRIEGTDNRISTYVKDATYGVNYAYSATNVFTDLAWFHLIVEYDSNVVRFFVNGVNVGYDASNDSIVNAYFPTKLPIGLNGRRDGSQTYSQQYRYDNIQFYDYIINQDQRDSLYNNGTTSFKLSSGEEGEEEPPLLVGYTEKKPLKSTVTKKFLRNTVWKIPYRKDYVEEQNPQDGLIVYFAENFNDWAIQNPIAYDTVMNRWQCSSTNFVSQNRANQSIISISGHGNVWRSQFLEGQGGTPYGFTLNPLLDEPNLEEIWVEVEMYLASNWYDDPSDGYYAGKWPTGGAVSGSGENGVEFIDSSDSYACKGFAVANVWGSPTGNLHKMHTYIYDQTSSKAALNIAGFLMNRGIFVTVTKRIVLNTPGLADGFIETYINGVLTQQVTGRKFRSLAQYNAGYNYIEGIILKYAFGGTSVYTSQQDNIVYFDNIVAYAYGVNSPFYIDGLAPVGHTIPVVSGTITNNVYPDKIWINRNYTASSGTICGLTTGSRMTPWCLNTTTDYRTFTISGHSNPIRLQFTKWYDGWNEGENGDMWVKIYSGVGTTKTRLYTYNEAARDGEPTIGATLTIPSTSCTIEYCTGRDSSYPFELIYW